MAHSHHALTGSGLLSDLAPPDDRLALARAMFAAPFGLLCHDGQADPRFIYANMTAQRLWGMPWNELVGMPSRLSAEPDVQGARAQMLQEAVKSGFFSGYSGVRIAANGARFIISNATIWNVTDESAAFLGQAAVLPDWSPLPTYA